MNFFTRTTVLACLLAASPLPSTLAAAICQTGQTSVCASCISIGTCTTVGQPVTETELCNNDQVCRVTNGVASCGPSAGSSCACAPFTLFCDNYDPLKVMVCASQSVPAVAYAPMLVQQCEPNTPCTAGRCAVPTTTPPTTSTTTPPTTPMTTPPTTSTTTTTTKPASCTAVNANKRFPHETECKKYYTCLQLTGGTYGYVISTCPSTYLYNRVTGFCDLPTNVACPK